MRRTLRGLTGLTILLSLSLAFFIDIVWLWIAVFVGFSLFQSAFTDWCLMMTILRKTGICK
ncbi:MAG: DUF2892 domain-containing protein [Candidatus Omnitrophota bacterium]